MVDPGGGPVPVDAAAQEGHKTQLLIGPHELGAAGPFEDSDADDVRLRNHLVSFTIRDAKGGVAMAGSTAGHVVDAIRHENHHPPHLDCLREIVIAVGMHVLKPTAFKTDTFDGGATVTVTGELVPFPVLAAALGSDKPNVDVSHTYTLRDGSPVLEIATTIRAIGSEPEPVLVADALFWSGDVRLFLPGHGVEDLPKSTQTDLFALDPAHDQGRIPAYAFGADKKLSMINAGGILGFLHPTVTPTADGVVLKRWLAVGGQERNDVASAMVAVQKARDSGVSVGFKALAVQHKEAGLALDGLDADGKPITRVNADEVGVFRVPTLDAIKSVALAWRGNGDGDVSGPHQHAHEDKAPWPIAGTSPSWPIHGAISVQALVDGQNAPFRVTIRGEDGDDRVFASADHVGVFGVKPGKYEVWVHHGPFCTQLHKKVEVKNAGQVVAIKAELKRVIHPGSWLSADLHVHAEASSDSSTRVRHRIIGAMADDLHYIVATDHDTLTDYQRFMFSDAGAPRGMSLHNAIATGIGVEVSTLKLGHFNAWPLPQKLDEPGLGAPSWAGKDLPTLAKDLRSRVGAKGIIQCNHPRFGDASVWETIGFDREKTEKSALPCDLIEVINGIAHKDTPALIEDWLALQKRGIHLTATGTSDCHGMDDFAGNPRTLVHVENWDGVIKKELASKFDAALKQGRAVATGGPWLMIEASAAGKTARVGDTLQAKGKAVTLKAVVAAPEWLPLGALKVYRNGALVHEQALAGVAVVGGKREVAVTLAESATATEDSAWSAVHVPGAAGSPGTHRPAWAVTNPVFVTR